MLDEQPTIPPHILFRYYLQRSTPSSNFSKRNLNFAIRTIIDFFSPFFDRFGFVFCSIARHDNEFYVFLNSQVSAQYLQRVMLTDVEEFLVLALNSQKRGIGISRVFKGTVDSCFSSQDVFRFAM